MDDELQQKCNDTLDNEDLLEEDKIEHIEQIVDEFYGTKNWSVSDKERLVLDILWKHRNRQTEGDKQNVVSNRKVTVKVVNTISKPIVPLPSDPTKLITAINNVAESPQSATPSSPGGAIDSNESGPSSSEGVQAIQEEAMSPFDILRGILGEENSDEQIHHALQKSEFDIQATLTLLMKEGEDSGNAVTGDGNGDTDSITTNTNTNTTVISSTNSATSTPSHSPNISFARVSSYNSTNSSSASSEPYVPGPAAQEKVMCKYFLQFGECLRADCKYSHDLSSRICRFWLRGGCLAGEECAFLHEIPQQILEKWTVNDDMNAQVNTLQQVTLTEDDFPALGAISGGKKKAAVVAKQQHQHQPTQFKPPGTFQFKPSATFIPNFQRDTNEFVPKIQPIGPPPVTAPTAPSVKITTAKTIPTKTTPNSTPTLPLVKPIKKLNRSVVDIKTPNAIPWVSTESNTAEVDPDHEQYVTYRLGALRHGEMRNKYLQLAVDRWHKNDAAGARTLSKKGQKHNNQMIDAYMNASDLLYEHRHKSPDNEIYIDLHGMELDESVDRLYEVLLEIEEEYKSHPKPVYSICGAGHHFSYSKKATDDKLSKQVKEFLDSKGYEWKEFNTVDKKFGKVIGIDPWSHI